MNVVCKENINGQLSITIGKSYEVIIDKYAYKIMDDNDEYKYYPKEMFKSLSEIRNEKINKLLA